MKDTKNNLPSTAPERPEIEYPCTWVYKVIGENVDTLKEVIHTACAPAPVNITHSHSSSGGKYHSLNAGLVVADEEIRLEIYELIKKHPAVKVVL